MVHSRHFIRLSSWLWQKWSSFWNLKSTSTRATVTNGTEFKKRVMASRAFVLVRSQKLSRCGDAERGAYDLVLLTWRSPILTLSLTMMNLNQTRKYTMSCYQNQNLKTIRNWKLNGSCKTKLSEKSLILEGTRIAHRLVLLFFRDSSFSLPFELSSFVLSFSLAARILFAVPALHKDYQSQVTLVKSERDIRSLELLGNFH